MNNRDTLLAFGACLFAICYLATIAAVLAYNGRYAEALGFGGLTTGLVGVLLYMRPMLTAKYVGDAFRADAKLFGYGISFQSRCAHASNAGYISIAKLRPPMRQSLRYSSMNPLVGMVFFGSCPSKIVNGVVVRVAVPMGNLMPFGRGRAQKGERYTTMHRRMSQLAVDSQPHFWIAFATSLQAFRGATAPVILATPNSTLIRRLIGGCERDRFPDFNLVSSGSHGAVPSRGGQGRDSVSALSRPNQISRFYLEKEAA